MQFFLENHLVLLNNSNKLSRFSKFYYVKLRKPCDLYLIWYFILYFICFINKIKKSTKDIWFYVVKPIIWLRKSFKIKYSNKYCHIEKIRILTASFNKNVVFVRTYLRMVGQSPTIVVLRTTMVCFLREPTIVTLKQTKGLFRVTMEHSLSKGCF